MDQNNLNQFANQCLVFIKHVATDTYLSDTGILNNEGSTLATQPIQKINSIWQLEKFFPSYPKLEQPFYKDTAIWPGDLVIIRNDSSKLLITSKKENKSPITKQGGMYLQNSLDGKGEQVFVIRLGTNNWNKAVFINVYDQVSLHSHKKYLKDKQIQYQEVTGFSERDDNDLWNIIPIDEETAKIIQYNIVGIVKEPRIIKYVHPLDKVVIRNCQTGGSLHSHNEHYQYGKNNQEVTWIRSIERDENDWWKLDIEVDDGQKNNKISIKSGIRFIHNKTKKQLTHEKGVKNKNKDFDQVSCGQVSYNEFAIECADMGIKDLQYLICEYPFKIKHQQTKSYLTALNRGSSKTTYQGEVVLSDQQQLWMIEVIDSIFD